MHEERNLPSPMWAGKAFCKTRESENLLIDQLFIKRQLHQNARRGFANRASWETAFNSQKHPFVAIILHGCDWWFEGWIIINLLNHCTVHGEAWASGDFQLQGVAHGFICPQRHVYHTNTAEVRAEQPRLSVSILTDIQPFWRNEKRWSWGIGKPPHTTPRSPGLFFLSLNAVIKWIFSLWWH